MVKRRNYELSLPPTDPPLATGGEQTTTTTTGGGGDNSYRRFLVRGRFDHKNEVLVGPRGPPLGALAKSGPMSGRSGGGMGVSPQGFYVVTPFVKANDGGAVLVNRGWVPKRYHETNHAWVRPTGDIDVVGVLSKIEKPRYLTPKHSIDQIDERKLIWMDREALEEASETYGQSPLLVTETSSSTEDGEEREVSFPVRPKADTVGDFTVLPSTHAGYAVTWFSLSCAGMVMTRKLLTKGRA